MNPIQSTFFKQSLKRASIYIRDHRRIGALLASVSLKMRNSDMSAVNVSRITERIKIMMRLIKAYITGTYRSIPIKSICIITGGLIYFVTPLDMIPDFIPISGLIDDFTVLVWVYNMLYQEMEKYIEWEHAEKDNEASFSYRK